ncbi:penicillin-binding transpeptidase domain-containing protein [Vibrio sinaloensis]|nr:penicillin-binding transpeptidase domain-containing protein [Vibrio sinaloensis]
MKSIEESVDTFFYQVAYDMGIDRISRWMMMFGFGDYTGIDIYEESKANMPTRDWKNGSSPHTLVSRGYDSCWYRPRLLDGNADANC